MAVDEAAAGLGVGGTLDDSEHFISSCPNTCCTGAFIKETMAGVIMSADIRELVFTNGKVCVVWNGKNRTVNPGCWRDDGSLLFISLNLCSAK